MAKLGFVGLGVMGGNMVSRLLEKGHSVTGYNRTRSKAQGLIDRGMRFAETPRAVAEASHVTFTMVTNAAALAADSVGPDVDRGRISPATNYIYTLLKLPQIYPAPALHLRDKKADPRSPA